MVKYDIRHLFSGKKRVGAVYGGQPFYMSVPRAFAFWEKALYFTCGEVKYGTCTRGNYVKERT